MTIDERLDRLTERHEALKKFIKLLAMETRELRAAIAEDGEHMRTLARIAEIHERRITRLEGSGEDGS